MPQAIRRALISVSDKTGIVELAQNLHDNGVELLSTGAATMIARSGTFHSFPMNVGLATVFDRIPGELVIDSIYFAPFSSRWCWGSSAPSGLSRS